MIYCLKKRNNAGIIILAKYEMLVKLDGVCPHDSTLGGICGLQRLMYVPHNTHVLHYSRLTPGPRVENIML